MSPETSQDRALIGNMHPSIPGLLGQRIHEARRAGTPATSVCSKGRTKELSAKESYLRRAPQSGLQLSTPLNGPLTGTEAKP